MRHLKRHPFAFAIVLLSTISATVAARCSCGYSVNSNAPNTSSTNLYTQFLETDFLHLYNLKNNPCWQPQEYNVTAAAARGSQGQYATPRNVVANPLVSWDAWSGDGVLGGDPGLRVWVNSSLVAGMVPMGEMVSVRNDMVYGSYRINMQVTGTPGTCGAFFWYRNNSEEIDMEFLSSNLTANTNPVFLVMQTPASLAAGYNAADTSTYQIAQLPFMPDTDFHEYRFDWSPEKVDFYADGKWLKNLYWTYPMAPGHLSFNHWSNGNVKWSQGPPAQDAVLVVKYVKAYFNTSDDGKNEAFEEGCYLDKSSVPCQVPEYGGQVSAGGNLSTFFFDRGMCGEKISAKGAASGMAQQRATATALSWFFLVSVILWWVSGEVL